jgi:hypothetical protein
MNDVFRLRQAAAALLGLGLSAGIGSAGPAAGRAGGAEPAPATAWDGFRRGEREAAAGNLEEALAAFSAARRALAASEPFDRPLGDALAVGLYNLAAGLNDQGRTELALRAFEEIYGLRAAAGRLRDAAFERTVREGAERVAAYAVQTGKASSAASTYGALVEAHPADLDLLVKRAEALLAAGRVEEAERAAAAARRAHAGRPEPRLLEGRVEMAAAESFGARGDHREARLRLEWSARSFEEAASMEPESAPRIQAWAAALDRLAGELRAGGDVEGASATAERALAALETAGRLAPDGGGIPDLRGSILRSEGRLLEAADAFGLAAERFAGGGDVARAQAARERRASALLGEAALALNEGRFDEAARAAAAAGEAPGSAGTAAALRGALEERRRRESLIREENLGLLEREPRRGDALLALGDLAFLRGRYDEALALYERLAAATEGRPPAGVLRSRLLRARPPERGPGASFEVEAGAIRVRAELPRAAAPGGLRPLIARAWSRAAAALGPVPDLDAAELRILSNQRAFREAADRGTPPLARSAVARGRVLVVDEPGRDPDAWTALLAEGAARLMVARLSRARAPRWLEAGVASWAASGAAGGGSPAAASPEARAWVPAASLDEAWALSWGDPEPVLRIEHEARRLVAALAARAGPASPRRLLLELGSAGAPGLDAALRAAAGLGLAELEAAARPAEASPTAP